MVKKVLERIGVGRRHWNYLLLAERNASPSLARRIEDQTGIGKEVFVFGSKSKRKAEWKKFLQRYQS